MGKKKKTSVCEKAILDTLAYSAVFKYPLSFYQVGTYLITPTPFTSKELSKALTSLCAEKKVSEKDNRFYLAHTRNINWQERAKTSEKLLARTEPAIKLLGAIPWIKMLAITGSVASFNADKTADIDIFIITATSRVWLTRGFVVLILSILKVYSQNGEPKKLCPNLFVADTHMKWPKDKQNVFVARDIVTMLPIINRANMYFKFLTANKWIYEHFANFSSTDVKTAENTNITKSPVVNLLENVAIKAQLAYMKNKKTTEITEKHLIHFLKKDNSSEILLKYGKVQSQKV